MTITEIKQDLFTVSEAYVLVHCISADFALGAGIAKDFEKNFNCREELFENYEECFGEHGDFTKQWDAGFQGFAIPTFNNRPVLHLITKRNYYDKPTMDTMLGALSWLKGFVQNGTTKIAMPRIGCGLDKLNWDEVKALIIDVFQDTDVDIIVCTKD